MTDSTGATASVTFSWQIAYVYATASRVDIPDNGAAVESPVTITGRDGNASATTKVYVNIVHTYRGDLTVDLVGPDGTVYSLLNRSGGSADDVDQTFTVDASAQTAQRHVEAARTGPGVHRRRIHRPLAANTLIRRTARRRPGLSGPGRRGPSLPHESHRRAHMTWCCCSTQRGWGLREVADCRP